jgi:uncharacterized protein (TIGR02246 family)
MNRLQKQLITCAVAVCAICALTPAAKSQTPKSNATTASRNGPADREAIRELDRRDMAASKTNDVDTLASLWTDDGVLLQPGTGPVIGKQAIRAMLDQQKQQAAQVQILAYDETWNEVRVAGDYAWEWGQITTTIKLPNGKEIDAAVNAVRILARQSDGSWKVARAIVTPAPKK